MKNKSRKLIFLSLVPIILFSTFRGTMGPDTNSYIKIFNDYNELNDDLSLFNEPLFYILLFISKKISENIEFFFFLNSTLVVFLYTLLINKFDLAKIFLLSIGPVFLIDTLTNGMRIGIAYQILALGLIINTGNKRLTIIASLFHISSVFYFFHNKLINPIIEKIDKKSIVLFSLFFILSPILLYLIINDQRLFDKLKYYSSFSSPSIISGVSDIYIILMVSLLSISNQCSKSNYIFKISLLFLMIFLFKFAAIYSYAILRLIKIMMLSSIIYSRTVKNKSKLLENNVFLFVTLLIPYTLNFMLYIYRNPEIYL